MGCRCSWFANLRPESRTIPDSDDRRLYGCFTKPAALHRPDSELQPYLASVFSGVLGPWGVALLCLNLDQNPLASIPATRACPSGAHPYPSRRPNSLAGDLDWKDKVEVVGQAW